MEFDLFQRNNVLSMEERMIIIANLGDMDRLHPYCSACSSEVDISFMRKFPEQHVNESMCLPCFLHNHTNHEQSDIDRIVQIANEKGWYYD